MDLHISIYSERFNFYLSLNPSPYNFFVLSTHIGVLLWVKSYTVNVLLVKGWTYHTRAVVTPVPRRLTLSTRSWITMCKPRPCNYPTTMPAHMQVCTFPRLYSCCQNKTIKEKFICKGWKLSKLCVAEISFGFLSMFWWYSIHQVKQFSIFIYHDIYILSI